MGFGSVRVLLYGIGGLALAQEGAIQAGLQSVPFIGCKSAGQVGPLEAPKGTSISIAISQKAAKRLAYYKAWEGVGVLAPRGWYCFRVYGSGGDALIVSPRPDTADRLLDGRAGIAGPAITVCHRSGGTSGRFDVAAVIARVFPAYRAFVTDVMVGFDFLASSIVFGPYPRDTLTYRSERVVEYRTPAQTDGLGTYGRLSKDDLPISGVAMLVGQMPDLLLLSVRLPRAWEGLEPEIVRQLDRDAAHLATERE